MGRTLKEYRVKRIKQKGFQGIRYSEGPEMLSLPYGTRFFSSDKVEGLSEQIGSETHVSNRVVDRLLRLDPQVISEIKD